MSALRWLLLAVAVGMVLVTLSACEPPTVATGRNPRCIYPGDTIARVVEHYATGDQCGYVLSQVVTCFADRAPAVRGWSCP